MPAVPELVTVVVDGKALQGWQSVHITRSAKAAAIAFSLGASNPAWSADARAMRRGKMVEVYTTADTGGGFGRFTGGDLLCTGYVDNYQVELGESSHEVGVSGRSKAGDAIDCPPVKHKTGLVEKKTLLDAAKEFDEWGIGFTSDLKLPKLAEVQLVPGEPLFYTLEREARHLGVLLMGQPDGSVAITRAGKNRHAGVLVEGFSPITKIKLSYSVDNKRSEIRVRGQRTDGVGKESLRQEETERDETVGRHRPYILFNEGDGTSKELKRRARWERLRRAGSGLSVSLTVSTWRDEAGTLWEPGRLVAVKIPSEEVDQDFAIANLTFDIAVTDDGGSGTTAELTLVDPRTLGGKASGSGSGSGAGDGGGAKSEDFDPGAEIEDQGEEGA